MKTFSTLLAALSLVPHNGVAAWFQSERRTVVTARGSSSPDSPASSGCAFTISSSGSFVCPAGQLADGQIRLNGSEPTATFYIDGQGAITDSNGFGCIVTDPPTTQFQCDSGKTPGKGFSIDGSDTLLYQGSSNFWACPATDTEYNVYVSPDFGQQKCFPISLKASSGCGIPAQNSSSCASVSTAWATGTQTVTENVTQMVTVVVTVSSVCSTQPSIVTTPAPSSWRNSSTSAVCHKCTRSDSDQSTWTATTQPTTTLSKDFAKRYSHTYDETRSDIRRRSSSGHRLSKRALFDDWQTTMDNQITNPNMYKWTSTGQVNTYDLTIGLTQWFGTTLYTGCTVFVVLGAKKIMFGHIREIMTGTNGQLGCPLDTRENTEEVLIGAIESAMQGSPADVSDNCNQRYAWIMGSVQDTSYNGGPAALKEWFVDEGIPPANVHYNYYTRGDRSDSSGPGGKGLVKWDSVVGGTGNGAQSTLTAYFSSETPRIVLVYRNDDRALTLERVDTSISALSTDGNKVYPDAPSEEESSK